MLCAPRPLSLLRFFGCGAVALPSPANLVPFLAFAFFLLFFSQNGGGGECFCNLSIYFLFFLFVLQIAKLFGGGGQNGAKQQGSGTVSAGSGDTPQSVAQRSTEPEGARRRAGQARRAQASAARAEAQPEQGASAAKRGAAHPSAAGADRLRECAA